VEQQGAGYLGVMVVLVVVGLHLFQVFQVEEPLHQQVKEIMAVAVLQTAVVAVEVLVRLVAMA
jgi:hypothetical protein